MSNALTIEKGIPLPAPRMTGKKGYNLAAILRAMEPGESVLAKGRSPDNVSSQARVVARVAADGRAFAVRNTPEGPRVWRIA